MAIVTGGRAAGEGADGIGRSGGSRGGRSGTSRVSSAIARIGGRRGSPSRSGRRHGTTKSRHGRRRRSTAPRLNRTRRTAVAGAMMLIGGAVIALFAIIGLAISFSAVIDQTFMNLAFTTPDFDYRLGPNGEEGNATFDVYVIMRTIGAGLIAVVLIYGGLARVFESADMGLVNQGTSNRLFSKSVIFILVMFVFPPMWDGLSDVGDDMSLWIVNPLYTFDDDRPCPDAFYADMNGVWMREFVNSPYILFAERKSILDTTGGGGGRGPPVLAEANVDLMERLCRPELRVNYVFGQMLRNTEVNQLRDEFGMPTLNATETIDTAWMDGQSYDIMAGATGAITNLMLGLTKALVAIQVLILTILFGVMTDMLVHMVIAALPVFLVLSVLPYCDRLFSRFIEAVPALLLIPMMSAIIISVGAAAIAEAPTSAAGSPYTDPDEWGEGAGGADSPEAFDHVYTWITALGVVFFAITLPTMMVPWIGSSLHMAQGVVSSAVQSSSLIAGSAATGMASGAANARAGGGGIGSIIRGGLMGAGTAGMHAAGTAGMPMGGLGPAPGEVARGLESARGAMSAAAGSAEATTQRFQSAMKGEIGKDLSKGDLNAVRNAAQMGGGQGSLMPEWRDDLSNQRNAERLHKAFTNPKNDAFTMTQGITTGTLAGSMSPRAVEGWTDIVGETKGKLGNPELSTTGLDDLVAAQAKEQGPNTHIPTLKKEMTEESMRLRGLDPDNADHKKAFMSDLEANDKAIQARGGAEYENGEWWKDESNDKRPHVGSWEATNAVRKQPDPAAGAGQMQAGAGPSAGTASGSAGGGANPSPPNPPPAESSSGPSDAGRAAGQQAGKFDNPGDMSVNSQN